MVEGRSAVGTTGTTIMTHPKHQHTNKLTPGHLILTLDVHPTKAKERLKSNWTNMINTKGKKKMPLLYSVVARGTTVLARYATCAGNFAEVTEQIISKISPGEAGRLTYSHASYLFHYVAHDGIVYMCITDDEFERQRAFLFLEDIKQRFQVTYGPRVHSALPYAMNSEFAQVLAGQMKHYTESRDIDKISRLQSEVSDVKDILVKNIESLASRGEHLELLVNKTENLNTSAVTFKTTSRTLARSLWWKNVRIIIYIVLGVGVSIYVIGAMACGLSWQKCVGN